MAGARVGTVIRVSGACRSKRDPLCGAPAIRNRPKNHERERFDQAQRRERAKIERSTAGRGTQAVHDVVVG